MSNSGISTSIWRQPGMLYMLGTVFLFFSALLQAAPVLQAQVDRSSVNVGDTLTLTLRLNDSGDDAPDFSVLEKDFALMGENSSSGLSATIGKVNRWTEWQLTLSPLRAGKLTIPAFTIGGAQSQAIAIQANPAHANTDGDSARGDEPVFIEATLDRDSVYVQQQILLTVKIFQAIALNDMHITEPEFDNATVRKLAQDKYQRDINGTSYQVHELTYAIFPQQSGELTIPELVFSATEAQRMRSLFDFPRPGRSVRKLTRQFSVHVKPVPKQFTGKVWLPARNLTVQETWGGNPQQISVGNSMTRSIAIQADGLMAAQLPALELPQLSAAKLYADQPALDDQADASGLHGKRIEGAALIPTQMGELELPEVRIHWWDLDSDSEKVATIPAQTLAVTAGIAAAASAQNAVSPTAGDNTTATATSPAHAYPAIAATANSLASTDQRIWYGVTAVLAAGWLSTLWLYWRLKRALATSRRDMKTAESGTMPNQSELTQVIAACEQNQSQAAHTALSQWLRQTHPRTPTPAQWLEVLKQDDSAVALVEAIEQLDRHCYRENDSAAWDGAMLAKTLMQLQQDGKRKKSAVVSPLPPLYPAAR